jgi:hypothetical protein
VDCEEILAALQSGASPTTAEAKEHVAGCPLCAALIKSGGALGFAPSEGAVSVAGSDQLWLEIESALKAETGARAWLRSRPTYVRTALALLVAAIAVGIAAAQPRADWMKYAALSVWSWIALFSLIAVLAVRSALAPLAQPRDPLLLRRGLSIAALGLPAVQALLLWASTTPGPHAEHGGRFVSQAAGCFLYGTALTLPLVALLWVLGRNDRPAPGVLVFSGAASGLVANVALFVHCSIDDAQHRLAGHATIGLAFAFSLLVLFRALARRS